MKMVGAVGMLLAASLCLGGSSGAQTDAANASSAYVPTMTFDVASVRENKQADLRQGITMSGEFTDHTTHLQLTNWRIESIVSDAYEVDEWQIVGAPKWQFPTVFIIIAKGDADADAKLAAMPEREQRLEQEHMLQALLADRFKLKAHWETRQGDVFNLVIAKGGPRLVPAGSMAPLAREQGWVDKDGEPFVIHQQNHGRGFDFIGHSCPMAALTGTLASQFGRPVIDMTGLTGNYDFVLTYHGRFDSDRNPDDTDPTLPLDLALKAQLGLQVEKAKGPVKVLVIDHIEKPTEN